MSKRMPQYEISFPQRARKETEEQIDQHEEIVDVTFLDVQPSRTERFRIQDYTDVFAHAGLYEKIVHEELRCQSPEVMVHLVSECLGTNGVDGDSTAEKQYRILDLAAGNGIVGEELRRQLGVQVVYLVGSDVLPAAKKAAVRDRPGVYEAYVVANLGKMDVREVREVFGINQEFDVITMCAALGFEPALLALLKAVELLKVKGLVAICVNELSLANKQEGVWGDFMRSLAEDRTRSWRGMRELTRKRYFHRNDVRGRDIIYVVVVFQREDAFGEDAKEN